MTKDRTYAHSPAISRRSLLTAPLASGVALALPTPAASDHALAVLEVINELEGWQAWEPSSIVAAKSYAAYRLREALGLELPDPKHARLHLEYQNQSYQDYRRSV